MSWVPIASCGPVVVEMDIVTEKNGQPYTPPHHVPDEFQVVASGLRWTNTTGLPARYELRRPDGTVLATRTESGSGEVTVPGTKVVRTDLTLSVVWPV